MSDTADQPADLPAILARIDRDLAESAKLREESNKFAAEQHKLLAEQQKLYAEQQSSTRSSKSWTWRPRSAITGSLQPSP